MNTRLAITFPCCLVSCSAMVGKLFQFTESKVDRDEIFLFRAWLSYEICTHWAVVEMVFHSFWCRDNELLCVTQQFFKLLLYSIFCAKFARRTMVCDWNMRLFMSWNINGDLICKLTILDLIIRVNEKLVSNIEYFIKSSMVQKPASSLQFSCLSVDGFLEASRNLRGAKQCC